MESVETKLMVLIQSVADLSRITANHDTLLTKLVDDHEMRLRALEKCSLAIEKISALEKKFEDDHISIDRRLRKLENWRWYIIGGLAGAVVAFEIYKIVVH